MKTKLNTIALFVFYIIFLFLTTEFVVRLLALRSDSIKFLTYSSYRAKDFDKIVDWESLNKSSECLYKPGTVVQDFVLNSHGFMSPEISYKKEKNTFRIVFLGDSFSMGTTPYKYNFIRLIEEKLNIEKGVKNLKFQAINLGMPCVGTSIYLKQLEIEGIKYKPDLVVLGFFVGNDFIDDDINMEYINSQQQPQKTSQKMKSLLYESRLLTFLINLYKTNYFISNKNTFRKNSWGQTLGTWLKNNDTSYDPFQPFFSKDKHLEIKVGIIPILIPGSIVYKNIDLIEKNLISIKKLTDKNKIPLLVYIIPDEMQVNDKLLEEVRKKEQINIHEINLTLPQTMVKNILTKNKIVLVDLLPYFLQEKNPELLYQPRDTHFNSFGNKKTAVILTDEINKIINKQ